MIELQAHPRGTILPIHAQAGARRNGLVGIHAGRLRVAVTAAPEKGKANKAIVALLSAQLGVSKSSVELLSGASSPRKRFLIVGISTKALGESIQRSLESG